MRTSVRTSIVACIAVLVLSACGSNVASVPKLAAAPGGSSSGTYAVDGYSATFSEYRLPAGVTPADLTVGPDGAVWFANFRDFLQSPIAGGRITGTGAVTIFSLPPPLLAGGQAIASAGGRLWLLATDSSRGPYDQALVSVTPQGTVARGPTLSECCAATTQKLTVDRQGNLWLSSCSSSCTFSALVTSYTPNGEIRASVHVGDPAEIYVPNSIGAGPDGNMYLTATYEGVPDPEIPANAGVVFQISSQGAVLHRYLLPANSDPHGIVAGPDDNLWIAETGADAIVRMATTGAAESFPLPTPNARPLMIVKGSDGALWFTEVAGNAIGRITTSGSITEYRIPTPNSAPYGIASCPAVCENAHGRIWFTEQGGAIGKFEF